MATSMPAWLLRVRGHAIDLFFPARCLACGTDIGENSSAEGTSIVARDFCRVCLESLEISDTASPAGSYCLTCAARIPDYPGAQCPHCLRMKMQFDQAFTLGPYAGRMRKLVLRMKTDRSGTLARALARLLCVRLERGSFGLSAGLSAPMGSFEGKQPIEGEGSHEDKQTAWASQRLESEHLQPNRLEPNYFEPRQVSCILPIPMDPWKQVVRGTNGPATLARVIGNYFGIPVDYGLLASRRKAIPQKGLTRRSRFLNIRGAMTLRAGYSLTSSKILLVDDVLTTGATCSEAARLLKKAGAAKVSVAVIARTAG